MRARLTFLMFLAALAYFLLFHRTGFFLQDEGVIAYQALRVSHGQLPYRDFQTAYPPAAYYVHAILFKVFGPSLALLRMTGSVLCAATAALLLAAAAHVLPGSYALLPSALYVLLEDQESKGFVVHTLVYPARYVHTLWALSLCLTLAYARRPQALLATALGLVTAAIIGFKHTAGVYNAWAVGLCLILASRSRAAPRQRSGPLAMLPFGFLLAILAALPFLFGGFGGLREFVPLVLYLPLALAVLVLLGGTFPWPADARERQPRRTLLSATGADLLAFGIAALLPTALWVTYFAAHVGLPLLAQRLVLDGPAIAYSYTLPFPRPGPFTAGAAVLIAVALGSRALVSRRVLTGAAATRGLGVMSAVVAGAALVWLGSLLQHAWRLGDWELAVMHLGRTLDNLAFYLVFVIGYAFLPRLRRAVQRDDSPDPVLICWVHGVCELFLVYPRMDAAHLYDGVMILLIVGTVLLRRTIAFFQARAQGRALWLPAGALCTLAVVAAVKLIPRVDAQVAWHGGIALEPRTALAVPRGGLYGTGDQGEWFAILNRTLTYITARTAPGTPIFAYPALAGVYFLSGRENPSSLDYFYHGFGEGRDEVAVITTLEKTQVPLVVIGSDQTFDPDGAGYFPILKDYLARHFVERESFTGRQSFSPLRVFERMTP